MPWCSNVCLFGQLITVHKFCLLAVHIVNSYSYIINKCTCICMYYVFDLLEIKLKKKKKKKKNSVCRYVCSYILMEYGCLCTVHIAGMLWVLG